METLKTVIIDGATRRNAIINIDAIAVIEEHSDLDKCWITLTTGKEIIVQEQFEDLVNNLHDYREPQTADSNRTQYRGY